MVEQTPVPDFRILMLESERGWGQKTEYAYFSTFEEAKDYYDKDLAKREAASSTPEWYYICWGPIEEFDPMTKSWKARNTE